MKMWTDGQTDIGHINLIGRLVTRNPPKNNFFTFFKFLIKSGDFYLSDQIAERNMVTTSFEFFF